MTQSILEAQNLSKRFGGLVAVDGVSLSVTPGSTHTIIGPNGAGKTTFFNLLSGTLTPTSGAVIFKGQDITGLPTHRTAHLGIGRSFQITNVFPNLTVLENVRLSAQALGRDNFRLFSLASTFKRYEERAMTTIELVGLTARAGQFARTLSHGDQRKLELAILLAPDPELLLLDEPTAGMASEEVPLLIEVIDRIRAGGDKTIMLVEHKMDFVMNVSDRITVMHQGRLLADGTPTEIASDEIVQKAYLGELYEDFEIR